MSAPKNRAELVEVMAARLWFREFSMPWDKATRIQKDRFYRSARDTLETLEAAGVALVPVVATEEMHKAAGREEEQCAIHNYGAPPHAEDLYNVMLAASPYAPNPEARDE